MDARMIEQFNRECESRTDEDLLFFADNGYWLEADEGEPCREL